MSASKTRVYHRLQLAAHRVQKSADRAILAAAGVTTAQAAVLLIVASGGSVTQREVAAQLGFNESALTAMAQRLIGMGLLLRSRNEADARAWRLRISDNGRIALKQIEQPFRCINQMIEAALSPEEIAQFADYLRRIAASFDVDN
jgi:MarR family transcriptional regulator, organic hydroperoxide resistance regulator